MRPALQPAVAAARAALDRDGRRPVVVAHDIWLAAGLQRALPETALVCISSSDAVEHVRAGGTEVFCLAEVIGSPETAGMSSLELLQHPATAAFFTGLGPTAVLGFKPSERIAAAVAGLGGELLAAPTSVARAYENKLAFVAAAERAGVPRPFWEVRTLPAEHATLARDFGPRFVVQGARGNAGQRTWIVASQADLDGIPTRDRTGTVRVAEYLEGTPFTVTGVAFSAPGTGLDRHRLAAVIEPCRQVTGIDWLTPETLGSCGNAWGYAPLRAHLAEVNRCVRALAADLSANSYRGVFGVDFVLTSDGPVVIEVNPRMVASLPLATELDVDAGLAPLVLLHLLEMCDADLEPLEDQATVRLGTASQVILHRLRGDRAERPAGGVYRVSAGSVAFLRGGATLADVREADELLLVCRRTGEPVSERKEFARIYSRSELGEEAPGVRQLVHHVRHDSSPPPA